VHDGAVGPGVGAEEDDLRAEPPEAEQGIRHALVLDVPVGVDDEAVAAQGVSDRPGSQERQVDPAVANCSSISSRAPGWSSGSSAMSDVLSAPVGGGAATVRLTSTNLVTAFGLSPIAEASSSRS
jgi:hypothetical protein